MVELSWLDNSSGFLRFTEAERLLCIICRVKSTNFALFYTMVVLAYHMSTGNRRLEAARTGRAKQSYSKVVINWLITLICKKYTERSKTRLSPAVRESSPAFMCSFNRGNIEGTNSSKICV